MRVAPWILCIYTPASTVSSRCLESRSQPWKELRMVMALPSVSRASMDVQVLMGESGAELARMRVLWSTTLGPWWGGWRWVVSSCPAFKSHVCGNCTIPSEPGRMLFLSLLLFLSFPLYLPPSLSPSLPPSSLPLLSLSTLLWISGIYIYSTVPICQAPAAFGSCFTVEAGV